MHLMVYNYVEPSYADRYNSTFINLRIVNRSGADYDSVRFGMYTDMDLGGFNDDLGECDSTRSLWYVYNGDELDADTVQGDNAIPGYGTQPPAVGFKFLNQPMSSHSLWRAEEETVSTTELIELLNGTPGGAPHQGPGYSSRFQYPGGAWSDTFLATDSLADRRGVAGAGPYTWLANDTLCFDLAVIYARATSGGAYASVAALKQRADGVQAWFDGAQFACNNITDVVAVPELAFLEWSATPNPSAGLLTLRGAPADGPLGIEVVDVLGHVVHVRTLAAGTTTTLLDLSPLPNAAYVVRLLGGGGIQAIRIVKTD